MAAPSAWCCTTAPASRTPATGSAPSGRQPKGCRPRPRPWPTWRASAAGIPSGSGAATRNSAVMPGSHANARASAWTTTFRRPTCSRSGRRSGPRRDGQNARRCPTSSRPRPSRPDPTRRPPSMPMAPPRASGSRGSGWRRSTATSSRRAPPSTSNSSGPTGRAVRSRSASGTPATSPTTARGSRRPGESRPGFRCPRPQSWRKWRGPKVGARCGSTAATSNSVARPGSPASGSAWRCATTPRRPIWSRRGRPKQRHG